MQVNKRQSHISKAERVVLVNTDIIHLSVLNRYTYNVDLEAILVLQLLLGLPLVRQLGARPFTTRPAQATSPTLLLFGRKQGYAVQGRPLRDTVL